MLNTGKKYILTPPLKLNGRSLRGSAGMIRHLENVKCHHSAVALLLKAALIQVRDYRLLGASG
jgi:hypothetical protein